MRRININNISLNNLRPHLKNYTHFSFDLWLTLIKSNPLFKQKRDELLKSYFSINTDIEVVRKTMRYYDVLSNKISEKTGVHVHRTQIYLMVLNALDVDIQALDAHFIDNFYQIVDDLFLEYKPILLNQDNGILFKEMFNEGKTINILSNTAFIHGTSLRTVLEYYELSPYITFDLYSDEVGLSKPNINFFNLVFDNINKIRPVPKSEIVHIGDNPNADSDGANKAGFNSILINN